MIESVVNVSMRDENDLNCSYATVRKGRICVIVILKDAECAIFDYDQLRRETFDYHYLLIKHYNEDQIAYRDFLKLIGKMCKKHPESKYFRRRKDEDNRMISDGTEKEYMIREEEKEKYQFRFDEFKKFVMENRMKF